MPAAKPREGLRALLTGHIHDLLAKLAARPDLEGVVDTAAAADEFFEVYLVVMARPGPTRNDVLGTRITPAELTILGACTHQAQTAKRLAARLGRSCSSYFRAQLTSLCRPRGGISLLQRTPDGYRLPANAGRRVARRSTKAPPGLSTSAP